MAAPRKLSLLDVFCMATGAMISSGLFVLPGLAHARAGPSVILAYFLAGILALTGLLSQAELASAMPKTGGTYFYVMRSMGPAVGTVDGIVTWFSLSLKAAFALAGMAAFTAAFGCLRQVDIRLTGIVLCLVFMVANLVGIKKAGRLQVALVAGLLGILVWYVARGLPRINVHNLVPFAPYGVRALFTTAGFVFISYGGLLKVAAVAEEVRNPARTVPLGMILSLFAASVLYTLVVFVTSGVLGAKDLDHSLTPVSDGAGAFLGQKGVVLLSLGAILAFVSTANAGMMAASRYPVALARDGLVPSVFGRTSRRFGSPYVAILVTGGFVTASLFLDLNVLVKTASSVLTLTFLFSCLSVIIMRESRVQNYRPQFRSPLYPWVQAVGVVGCLALLAGIGVTSLLAAIALIGSGLFLYWFYGRIRATREYALLHLIERITARDLTDGLLETELKEIVRQRDAIVTDRFDRLVEACVVLDLDEPMEVDAFFRRVAEELAPRLGLPADRLLGLLKAREAESSTVIAPRLAIPHFVIDGKGRFDVLLARCRGGIRFPGAAEPVQSVFVLAGTRDERNFHLRGLAAIAQIVQDPGFYERWMKARGPDGLKDLVLLGNRSRR